MSDKERITTVEESVKSAHKRIDGHKLEIDLLRVAKHEHAGILQFQSGILEGLKSSVDNLVNSIKDQVDKTEQNTNMLVTFKAMAVTAIFMGGGFIGFCVFVGGKILKWW